jgi:hypothetical protein
MSLYAISNDLLDQFQVEARGEEPTTSDKIMDMLSKFIPTEILAPYVAALSLITTKAITWNEETIYIVFIVATPIVFLLFHYAKIASSDQKPWPTKVDYPVLIWKALAAGVAFAVWALAVPTNSLQDSVGGPAVASFFAMVISPILTAIDVILVRLFKTRQSD